MLQLDSVLLHQIYIDPDLSTSLLEIFPIFFTSLQGNGNQRSL
jgi:hypothetical protein